MFVVDSRKNAISHNSAIMKLPIRPEPALIMFGTTLVRSDQADRLHYVLTSSELD